MKLSNFPLHQQAIPTDRVKFADGSTSDYNPPFMTVDPRYADCTDHHVGCDCREAHLREEILEFKIEERIWKLAAEEIVGGHPQDTCMCTGCQIIRHRFAVSKRLLEEARVTINKDDTPNWGPLRALIPADQLDGWMWMARSSYDGTVVEHYKHRETRGGLTLDHAGNYWSSRIVKHACDPWCDEDHEHNMCTDVREYFTVTEVDAFGAAGVWPWSLHDKAHPAPEWVSR